MSLPDGVYDVLDWLSSKYRTLWLVFETIKPNVRHYWEPIVAHECSKVFLASQQVNGSYFDTHVECCLSFACSFFFFFSLPLLLSFQWACLEITHNAQPHKLTDSCSGVIRCEDRITQYPISIKISRHSFSDLMLLPSHVCVINNDSTTSRRCLRYIPVLDFTPPHLSPSLGVSCVTPTLAQACVFATAFRCYKGIYTAFTAYMPYWNAKCCLIFVFVLTFIKFVRI